MSINVFPTTYAYILQRMHAIDPIRYAHTRNYIDGDVTYLSPYLSRGVIHIKQIIDSLIARNFTFEQCEKLLQELCWREFYQLYHLQFKEGILQDIRHPQEDVVRYGIPDILLEGRLGIPEIDDVLHTFLTTGYMHNHARMYVASILCNVAHYHWKIPSQWMFAHLFDGDVASNALSWQWVAGCFSSKKYWSDQQNINRFLRGQTRGTYLDHDYQDLPQLECPDILRRAVSLPAIPFVLEAPSPQINIHLPTLLYHPSFLDPTWKQDVEANRIFVWDPNNFKQMPRSEKVQQFIYNLAMEIPGIQCWFGSVEQLVTLGVDPQKLFYQKHPDFDPSIGACVPYSALIPFVPKQGASFFSYWKKVSPFLQSCFHEKKVRNS